LFNDSLEGVFSLVVISVLMLLSTMVFQKVGAHSAHDGACVSLRSPNGFSSGSEKAHLCDARHTRGDVLSLDGLASV
jgi:hypothetical protein